MDDEKSGAYVSPPSGSFTSWENTLCNPLGDMRTQTQSAWHDGYASAKVEREWQELTVEEHTQIAIACGCASADWLHYGLTVERKLKEKNSAPN